MVYPPLQLLIQKTISRDRCKTRFGILTQASAALAIIGTVIRRRPGRLGFCALSLSQNATPRASHGGLLSCRSSGGAALGSSGSTPIRFPPFHFKDSRELIRGRSRQFARRLGRHPYPKASRYYPPPFPGNPGRALFATPGRSEVALRVKSPVPG